MDTDLRDLIKTVINSDKPIEEKKELIDELRKMAPPDENRWHYRIVLITLALVAVSLPLFILSTTLLHWFVGAPNLASLKVPDGLLSLGSAALGALAAYLNPQRKASPNPP